MPPDVASLVVGDLLTEARDLHPTFDDRRHPNRVLLRALGRYQRRLIPEITRRNRAILTDVVTQTFPLPDFEAGITIPDYTYPVAVEAQTVAESGSLRNREFQVELVAWEGRFQYHMAAYLRNNTLFLTGLATAWLGFVELKFYYVPEVSDLTALEDVLILPNSASPCLVAYLAAFMAQRGRADKPEDRPDKGWFRDEWRETEEVFFDSMGMHTQATMSVVREAF